MYNTCKVCEFTALADGWQVEENGLWDGRQGELYIRNSYTILNMETTTAEIQHCALGSSRGGDQKRLNSKKKPIYEKDLGISLFNAC